MNGNNVREPVKHIKFYHQTMNGYNYVESNHNLIYTDNVLINHHENIIDSHAPWNGNDMYVISNQTNRNASNKLIVKYIKTCISLNQPVIYGTEFLTHKCFVYAYEYFTNTETQIARFPIHINLPRILFLNINME